MSLKHGYNNLYLYNKLFKTTMKPNSHLTSISCRGLVNPSTLTFSNVNLKKQLEIHMLFQMSLKKAAIISICFLRSFIEAQSQIHIWCQFPVVPRSICKLQFLAISIWQKQWQVYLLLGNSIKKYWNNLYFHPKSFGARFPLCF